MPLEQTFIPPARRDSPEAGGGDMQLLRIHNVWDGIGCGSDLRRLWGWGNIPRRLLHPCLLGRCPVISCVACHLVLNGVPPFLLSFYFSSYCSELLMQISNTFEPCSKRYQLASCNRDRIITLWRTGHILYI